MKRWIAANARTLLLAGILLPLFLLFVLVLVRSGPLAPVPVSLMTVTRQTVTPSLFGIGTVEARFTHRIGPTLTGRLLRIEVQPGDPVSAGQAVGTMDPVDLDDRVKAQEAALRRAEAAVSAVEAQIREAQARKTFAEGQAERYARLLATRAVSREDAEARRQELDVARAAFEAVRANLEVARHDVGRLRAERDGLLRQRANLELVSPVTGLVARRDVDPGTTVVPGQPVLEVVEPGSIRLHVRFDQQRAAGLRAGLPARVMLRSLGAAPIPAQVVRVEPVADAVTEEVLAKVAFARLPATVPPLGELAEVTVDLPISPAAPVVLNSCLHRVDGQLGVWLLDNDRPLFRPVTTGAADLEGRVQILGGLEGGERVVLYSRKALRAGSRVKVVEHLPGKSP